MTLATTPRRQPSWQNAERRNTRVRFGGHCVVSQLLAT